MHFAKPFVVVKIIEERERCVNAFRGHVKSVEDRYLNKDWESTTVCPATTLARQCDAMQLGLLHRSSLLSPGTYIGSLISVAETVKTIPVFQLDVDEVGEGFCRCGNMLKYSHTCTYNNAHGGCGWVSKLHEAVDSCLELCKGLKFSEFPSRTWVARLEVR